MTHNATQRRDAKLTLALPQTPRHAAGAFEEHNVETMVTRSGYDSSF